MRGQIGDEKGLGLAEDGAGGEVAAADGALHGGGPAGLGVIAGEEQAVNAVGRRRLCGAETVDSRGRGEGGAFFDDDGAAEEFGVAGGGESPANLLGEKIESFFVVLLKPIARGADDAVNGSAVGSGFAEEPLQRPADEGGVRG